MTVIICTNEKCIHWKHAGDTTLTHVGICQSEEIMISNPSRCLTLSMIGVKKA